jgi:hypothetical protein
MSNPNSFRVFGPDETASNGLQAVYQASKKIALGRHAALQDGSARPEAAPGSPACSQGPEAAATSGRSTAAA